MKIYYGVNEDHLPYILASAVWHYLQYTEMVVNTSKDHEQVNLMLREQKIIKDRISNAVKHPLSGEQFAIYSEEVELNQLLTKVLHHYLEETKDILKTIKNPIITEKCLEDVAIIENQLIKAIQIVN